MIGKYGAGVAFVGSRFPVEELTRKRRLLFVTIQLPDGRIEALLTVLMHERIGGEDGTGKWYVGGSFSNMSEADTARLAAYLDKKKASEASPN